MLISTSIRVRSRERPRVRFGIPLPLNGRQVCARLPSTAALPGARAVVVVVSSQSSTIKRVILLAPQHAVDMAVAVRSVLLVRLAIFVSVRQTTPELIVTFHALPARWGRLATRSMVLVSVNRALEDPDVSSRLRSKHCQG